MKAPKIAVLTIVSVPFIMATGANVSFQDKPAPIASLSRKADASFAILAGLGQ
ncbi:MAG: hypothetical protein WBQ60_12540 [Asticcacaulis sp.]